jgi:hypothetical protein
LFWWSYGLHPDPSHTQGPGAVSIKKWYRVDDASNEMPLGMHRDASEMF